MTATGDSSRSTTRAGIYIHIPFCKTRCNYCHFITRRWDSRLADRYCRALLSEMDGFGSRRQLPSDIDSVYFGGGTPSMVPAEHIAQLLLRTRTIFQVSSDCEISIEANPGTLTPDKARAYVVAGVNRVSLGAQTFNESELVSISRSHSSHEIRDSIAMLRSSGIYNINMDLMLGLPGQTRQSWRENLKEVLKLNPPHLSIYMLDLDLDSPLKRTMAAGLVGIPDEDTLADLYTETVEFLAGAEYRQYEISNFSKPGNECRHNLKYWLRHPVFGFGVGSHSFDGMSRYANTGKLDAYLAHVEGGQSAVDWSERLENTRAIEEEFFLGLRLVRGVDLSELRLRYGRAYLSPFEDTLKEMANSGLIEWKNSSIRLTPDGILLSNEIFQQLLT